MTEQNQLSVVWDDGRDIVTFDASITKDAMKSIGINPGDIISIVGNRSTVAIAQHPLEPQDDNTIVISNRIMENATSSIGDIVAISKAKAKSATYLSLSPTSVPIIPEYQIEDFVRKRMLKHPVVSKDEILIPILGRAIPFKVVKTEPSGVVIVDKRTEIFVKAAKRLIEAPERSVYEISSEFSISVAKVPVAIETLKSHIDSGKVVAWLDKLNEELEKDKRE